MKISFDYFRVHDRGWVLSLLALSALVYLPFLGNPFIFDDHLFLEGEVANRYAHSYFRFDLRWFPYATLGWTAEWFSNVVPHFFHLGNWMLHAANVVLLFYLLYSLLAVVNTESNTLGDLKRRAWLAAMIFAVHPVAVFAVGYVVQRSIVMATLFTMLMQMAYLRGLLTGRWIWLVLTVTCYFIAVFSKEHSVLAPVTLVALTVLLKGKILASRRSLWLMWIALLVVAVLVTLRARGVLGSAYEPMAADLFRQLGIMESTPLLHLLSALTQAGLFFKYLLLWLLPNTAWISVDMREPFISTIGDWRGWFWLLAFVSYGMVGLRMLLSGGERGLAGFALLYPWIHVLVEMAGIRVQEPFVLYRSYLWMPGLMVLIPLLLCRFESRKVWWVGVSLVLLLVPLAWNRLYVFSDNLRLWNDAALLLKDERVAGADRIYYNRGQALMAVQQWNSAARDFERSAAISPHLAPIHHQLGVAYLGMGRYEDGLKEFDLAISIKPEDGRFYYAKGIALTGLQRREDATEQFRHSCKLSKDIAACLLASSPGK